MKNLFGVIGDMHFGVKAGDPNFLSFQKQWLEQSLARMQALGITKIIQTGDFFDTRSHVKLNVLHEVIHWLPGILRQYGITDWYAYAGNHDIFYRDSNDICSLDILSVLDDDELIFHINKDHVAYISVFNGKGIATTKIALLPWLNKNNTERLMTDLLASKADYVFGHLELIGMPMIKGVNCDHGIQPSALKQFKRVMSGHFHTVSESLNCTMVGSPYALTWNDYQDGDNRGFWVLDTDTNDLTLHKNDEHMTLFSVIVYDKDEKYDEAFFEPYAGTIAKVLISDKSDLKHFKKFNELLTKVGFIDYKIIDTSTIDTLNKVEISEETLQLDTMTAINKYIEGQADSVDKDRVKVLAQQIYKEVLDA